MNLRQKIAGEGRKFRKMAHSVQKTPNFFKPVANCSQNSKYYQKA